MFYQTYGHFQMDCRMCVPYPFQNNTNSTDILPGNATGFDCTMCFAQQVTCVLANDATASLAPCSSFCSTKTRST